MRRSGFVSTLFSIVLIIGCISACFGRVLPFPNIDRSNYDQYELFIMQQGWYNSKTAWFIRTDVNLVKTAFDDYSNSSVYWQGLTYAPKLTETADNAAYVYFNLNYQQGPVFTAMPGETDYSGVWRAIFIKFHSGITPRPINNADEYDPIANPYGLPPLSDADRLITDPEGRVLVVKYPIVAVGALGGPWYPAVTGSYRIPQGKVDYNYTYTKQIWLPYWYVYCQDQTSQRVSVRRVIVPDIWEPADVPTFERIGPRIGANIAPGLQNISDTAEEGFYYMNDPKPYSQLPVIEACPTNIYYPWLNTNPDYSPVMKLVVLERNIPASSVITNLQTINKLKENQKLPTLRDDQILNAPVIPELQLPG